MPDTPRRTHVRGLHLCCSVLLGLAGCSRCADPAPTLVGTSFGGGAATVQLDASAKGTPETWSVDGSDLVSGGASPSSGAWSLIDVNGNGTFGVAFGTPADSGVTWAGRSLAVQVSFNHAAVGAGEQSVPASSLDIRPGAAVLAGFAQAARTVVDDTHGAVRVEGATFGCMGDTGAIDTGPDCELGAAAPVTIQVDWALDDTVQADVTMLSPGCL